MTKRNETRGFKRKRVFFLANVVVVFFLLVAFGREYVGNIQIQHEIKQLEEERAMLEQDQLNTLSLLEDLSSEFYLEQEARTKHGLGREGETLIVMQDETHPEGDVLGTNLDRLQFVPNYERWFYFFFDQERFEELSSL